MPAESNNAAPQESYPPSPDSNRPTYTADDIARAARELREAAGAPEQRFTADQVVAMLSDEIRLLRERGFSDERIADLFTGFDIAATPDEVSRA